jgi:hypothetical protein
MLNRIDRHATKIEEYLKNTVPDKTKHIEHRKLYRIVKLLKQTYHVLPNNIMTPLLSLKHIAEILLKVYDEIHALKETNTEPASTSYTQLLLNTLTWAVKETDILHLDIEGMQIILPIDQSLDKRRGFGQCSGYLQKWAHDMYLYNQWLMHGKITKEKEIPSILNKIPFHGISQTHFPPLFMRNLLPELLHIAPITNEIQDLQRSQYKLWRKKNYPRSKKVRSFQLISSIKTLTNELIACTDKHSNEIIEVSFISRRYLLIGHVIGLIKTNDHYYHFFDANIGYCRFSDATVFKEWFPKYYHSIYDFIAFSIQIIPPPRNSKQVNNTSFLDNYFSLASRIILTSFECLCGTLKLRDIHHDINNHKYALTTERKQIFNQIWKDWRKKVKAHSPMYYKSQLWFSDDMRLEMKKFSRCEYKAGSQDDMALLPRFFPSKKI